MIRQAMAGGEDASGQTNNIARGTLERPASQGRGAQRRPAACRGRGHRAWAKGAPRGGRPHLLFLNDRKVFGGLPLLPPHATDDVGPHLAGRGTRRRQRHEVSGVWPQTQSTACRGHERGSPYGR